MTALAGRSTDGSYSFSIADFGFSDVYDNPANSFISVIISSLPVYGSLKLSGTTVTLNQEIAVANIPLLVFAPALNGNGIGYSGVGFRVKDSGGVTNGGVDVDPTPKAITFNVTPVNDAPTGSVSISGSAIQGQILTASNSLADVEGLGTITYYWIDDLSTILGSGSSFTLGQAQVGKTIRVNASYNDGNGAATSVVSAATGIIANVNDAPTGTNKTIALLEDGSYTFNSADFGFTDSDSPANTFLSVIISSLPSAGTLKFSGTAVTLNQEITVANIPNLVFAPVANGNGNNYSNFTFKVKDNGGTANGGVDVDPSPNAITFNVTPVNDAPTGSVSISGSAAQGQILTANVSTLADVDGLGTITYTWKDNLGTTLGTGNSFTLGQAQVGKTVSVTASYTDGNGTAESVSAATTSISNINDAGSVSISGSALQGQILTALVSDPDGFSAVNYQWKANGINISGATSSTFALTQSQVGQSISVSAIYTDNYGSAENVNSAPTSITNVNDLPTGSVSISGINTQGQTLTATNTLADVDGLGAITYTWKDNLGTVLGTGSTFVLTQAQVGKTVTATASYTDGFGAAETVISAATASVANVNDAPGGTLTISGTAAQGQTLSVLDSITDADGLGARTYTWKEGVNILGTGTSLVLSQAHVGKNISVTATYTDSFGTAETVVSAATTSVANVNDAPGGTLTISGTAAQGQTLSVLDAITDADGLGARTYTWKEGANILGTGTTLLLTQAHVGKNISVTANYTDGFGAAETKVSSATASVANVNDAPGGSLTISGTATQGQTLSVLDAITDADGLGARSYTWKEGANILGTGTTLLLTQAHVGKNISVTANYTDGFGTAETMVSAASSAVANVNDAPTGNVVISGTAATGLLLTASNTLADIDGLGAISYQWLRNGSTSLGSGSTYTPVAADGGQQVTVKATYTDGQGTVENITSAAVVPVNNIPHTGGISISGSLQQGQRLKILSDLADANGMGSLSIVWKDSLGNTLGQGGFFDLKQVHVGKQIQAVATYTDGTGVVETASSALSIPVLNVNDAPSGSLIINGTAAEDQILFASNTLSDVDGLGSISYSWKDSNGNVLGSGTSLTLGDAQVGKNILLTASYTDAKDTLENVVTSTGKVTGLNDVHTGTVTISGTAKKGYTWTSTSTLVDADGLGTLNYQWQSSSDNSTWNDINGATADKYRIAQAETGKYIRLVVSYIDGQGFTETQISNASGWIMYNAVDATGLVMISGSLIQNQVLTASVGNVKDFNGQPTTSLSSPAYQWQADGVDIVGATASTFTLTKAQVGKAISVIYSGIDDQSGMEFISSAKTGLIANVNELPVGAVNISGVFAVGQTLVASDTLTDADGKGAVTYTWSSSDGVVLGTGSSLKLTSSHIGMKILATATYTDGLGTIENVYSGLTIPVVANSSPTGAVSISGTFAIGNTLTASDSITDADGKGAVTYTWLSAGGTVLGTGNTYTVKTSDLGAGLLVRASYVDGHVGQVVTETVDGSITGVANFSKLRLRLDDNLKDNDGYLINSSMIDASYANLQDSQLTFTYSSAAGTSFTVNKLSSSTFTLKDVKDGLVRLVTPATTTLPEITVTLKYGATDLKSAVAAIEFLPMNYNMATALDLNTKVNGMPGSHLGQSMSTSEDGKTILILDGSTGLNLLSGGRSGDYPEDINVWDNLDNDNRLDETRLNEERLHLDAMDSARGSISSTNSITKLVMMDFFDTKWDDADADSLLNNRLNFVFSLKGSNLQIDAATDTQGKKATSNGFQSTVNYDGIGDGLSGENGGIALADIGTSLANIGDYDHRGQNDLMVGMSGADAFGRVDAGGAVILWSEGRSAIHDFTDIAHGEEKPNGIWDGDEMARYNDTTGDGKGGPAQFSALLKNPGTTDEVQYVQIYGAAAGDMAGSNVASVGDLNRDGFADVAILASGVDVAGKVDAGTIYILRGQSVRSTIDLATMNTNIGVKILGADSNAQLGKQIIYGNFNGDQYKDIVASAAGGDGNGRTDSGVVYALWGRSDIFKTDVNLAENSLTAAQGLRIIGANAGDAFGTSITQIDLDKDGIDELIISAVNVDANGMSDVGAVYVLWGSTIKEAKDNGNSVFDVRTMTKDQGFIIYGDSEGGHFGTAIMKGGDYNGDGVTELLVSSPDASNGAGRVDIIDGALMQHMKNQIINGVLMNHTAISFTGTAASETWSIDLGKDYLIGLKGGAGTDTLKLTNSSSAVTSTVINGTSITGINGEYDVQRFNLSSVEILDLSADADSQLIHLDRRDAVSLTDFYDFNEYSDYARLTLDGGVVPSDLFKSALRIKGGSNDRVDLHDADTAYAVFQKLGTPTQTFEGTNYDVYQSKVDEFAVVLIQQAVQVIL